MAEDYERLTVKLLKEEAAKRDGLTIKSGLRKAEIIEKLREWDVENAAPIVTDLLETQEHEEPVIEVAGDAGSASAEDAMEVEAISEDPTEQVALPLQEDEQMVGVDDITEEPPAIETAPAQVSALSDPAKEPTPPPHHETIQPVQSTTSLLPSKEPEQESKPDSALLLTSDEPSVVDRSRSAETRVPTQELLEDSCKRKRRSQSPTVEAEAVEAKRAKMTEEVKITTLSQEPPTVATPDDHMATSSKVRKDFRQLFDPKTAPNGPARVPTQDRELPSTVEPALHVAERGLVIANLKRPLNVKSFERHLNALAAPSTPEHNSVELMHVDQIKTHALVLLTDLTSAARVRASLHLQRFPDEADRDLLFVDFVPEGQLKEFIQKENEAHSSGRTAGLRWEVTYTADGEAVHQEVGVRGSMSGPSRPAARASITSQNIPTGPRGSVFGRDRPPGVNTSRLPPRNPQSFGSKPFQALDDMFKHTSDAIKPRIYYSGVDPRLAEKRLEELRHMTGKGWEEGHRKHKDYLVRYTFQDGDHLVNGGSHHTGVKNGKHDRKVEKEYYDGKDKD